MGSLALEKEQRHSLPIALTVLPLFKSTGFGQIDSVYGLFQTWMVLLLAAITLLGNLRSLR